MSPENTEEEPKNESTDDPSSSGDDAEGQNSAKQPVQPDNEDLNDEIDQVLDDLEQKGDTAQKIPLEEAAPKEAVMEEEWEEPLPTDNSEDYNTCHNCGRELFNGECLHCTEDWTEEEYEDVEEEFEEDLYSQWREEMKKRGELNIIGIFCVIVVSIYIIYISFPEVLAGFTGDFTFESFTFHFVLLLFGIGALFGGFVMGRHVIIYGRLFDTTFEKEIYSRLEPAFAEVGSVRGDLQELYDKMERINLHISRVEKRVLSSTNGGSADLEVRGNTRYIFLMILTMAVFFYILRYPGDYAWYVLTGMFLVWWAGITSDYRLWKVNFTWTWSFFAVVVIPISSMLMLPVLGISVMMGVLGIALTLYALSFYTWAKFYVEGVAPGFFSTQRDEE